MRRLVPIFAAMVAAFVSAEVHAQSPTPIAGIHVPVGTRTATEQLSKPKANAQAAPRDIASPNKPSATPPPENVSLTLRDCFKDCPP